MSLELVGRGREAKSLTKIMKSRGPKIEPCGTPDSTGTGKEIESTTLTDCERLLR